MRPSKGTFRSLHNRNFRLFMGGHAVSSTGTWMQRVAQDWLVLQLSHGSGTALGITLALQFLPLLLLGLWGGVIADRYSKRRLLLITQASMGLQALTLGVLTVSGMAEIWHVYALAFGLGLVTAFDNPTRQSFVIEMVGRDELPNAVALNSATFQLARVVGPALAGLAIAAMGIGPVFLLNALSYVALLIGLSRMQENKLHLPERAPRSRGQLREGLRYVRSEPVLLLALVIVAFVATFGLKFQVTLAMMANQVFHTGASGYGLLSSAVAAGSVAGALVAARRSRPRLRLVVGSAIVFGVLMLVTAVMPTYWLVMAMLVPTGVAALTFNTAANSTVQLTSSPVMRGRVMSLYMLVFLGSAPIGAPAVGWVAEAFGPRYSVGLGGVLAILAAVVAAAVLLRRQGLVVRAHVRPRPGLDIRSGLRAHTSLRA
ncbi:MAG: MFS transporter [Streptosporangiales bacterium]|nr:MFS transporter [Streptosporangiales bacterium]